MKKIIEAIKKFFTKVDKEAIEVIYKIEPPVVEEKPKKAPAKKKAAKKPATKKKTNGSK